jgi:molybdopterin-guanine dinucleotide biosynthesis protein A
MPFLNAEVLEILISNSSNYDVVIPSVRDERKASRPGKRQDTAKELHLHPLHALYRKTCRTPMRRAIERGDLRMVSFHEEVRVKYVTQAEIDGTDPEHLSFWNVNTPEELERAEQVSAQIAERE